MSTQRWLGALEGIGGNGGGTPGAVCISGEGAGGTLAELCFAACSGLVC